MSHMDIAPLGDGHLLARLRRHLDGAGVDPAEPLDTERAETPQEAAVRRATAARARAALWDQNTPALYRGAHLDALDGAQAPETIREWMTDPGARSLFLAGPQGTGKTYAAYATARAFVDAGAWAEVRHVAALLDAIRPGGDPREWDRLVRCDVLCLDDLAQARATDWTSERMYLLIDQRVNAEKRHIVTTNHTHEALEATWGRALLDRLTFRSKVIVMAGESRRKAAW